LKKPWENFVPKIASAKKHMRKSRAATARNRAQRAALRTALKKAKAPGATTAEKVAAARLADRAARKGLLHRNAAARHKSQIARGA
jgi:small subunit ribosomal protein S20